MVSYAIDFYHKGVKRISDERDGGQVEIKWEREEGGRC